MRKCPKCGRAYSDFVEICPQCNISLTGDSENSSLQMQEDVPTARKASQERQVEHKVTAGTIPMKKHGTKRKILPVAIAALVLVAAIILVCSGTFRTSDSNEAAGNNIEAASGSGTSGSDEVSGNDTRYSYRGGNSSSYTKPAEQKKCSECGGTGYSDQKCTYCGGNGTDPSYELTEGSVLQAFAEKECVMCDGTGFKKCYVCDGTGWEY